MIIMKLIEYETSAELAQGFGWRRAQTHSDDRELIDTILQWAVEQVAQERQVASFDTDRKTDRVLQLRALQRSAKKEREAVTLIWGGKRVIFPLSSYLSASATRMGSPSGPKVIFFQSPEFRKSGLGSSVHPSNELSGSSLISTSFMGKSQRRRNNTSDIHKVKSSPTVVTKTGNRCDIQGGSLELSPQMNEITKVISQTVDLLRFRGCNQNALNVIINSA